MICTVVVSLEQIELVDSSGFQGHEVYFIGSVGGHATGRSQVCQGDGAATLALDQEVFSFELHLPIASAPIAIDIAAWDEELALGSTLGRVAFAVPSPFSSARGRVLASDGTFALHYSIVTTSVDLDLPPFAPTFRQPSGGRLGTTLTPAPLAVQITEIRGLYKPLANPPPGDAVHATFVPGYASEDDKGRIYLDRLPDGSFRPFTQFIELFAEVFPTTALLADDDTIRWTVEDPDDPTNEDPLMRKVASREVDPGDFDSDGKVGAVASDNDPTRVSKAVAPWFEDLGYGLSSGNETRVDVRSRLSGVRLHLGDVAGDNYRVRAEIVTRSGDVVCVPFSTGIMTLWKRIEIEYVRMASAPDLPLGILAEAFAPACTQFDVSITRVATGSDDLPFLGKTEVEAAAVANELARAGRQYTKQFEPGFMLVVSANRHIEDEPVYEHYVGDAEIHDAYIRLLGPMTNPVGPGAYLGVVFYDPLRSPPGGTPSTDPTASTFRRASVAQEPFLWIPSYPYYLPDAEADSEAVQRVGLLDYGFTEGERVHVRVASGGGAGGISLVSPAEGKWSNDGRLFVFAQHSADVPGTLCHELAHALGSHHRCGSWDWRNPSGAASCCMNDGSSFILEDEPPSAKSESSAPWTYTVRAGDYPTKIAEDLVHDFGRWRELVDENCPPMKKKDGTFANLQPGDVLMLPASWIPLVSVTPTPRGVNGPGLVEATQWEYLVQSGDYPMKIAEKCTGDAGRWRELVEANSPPKKRAADGNFESLYANERLVLPASWSTFMTSGVRPEHTNPLIKRRVIPWSGARGSIHFCGKHIRHLRNYRLTAKPQLHWV